VLHFLLDFALAILTQNRPGPDDTRQLIYTSGPTGEPKRRNVFGEYTVPYAERLKDDIVLMASPMAHWGMTENGAVTLIKPGNEISLPSRSTAARCRASRSR
jgi:hypothetical protein